MHLLDESFEVVCGRLRILRHDKETNCDLTCVNTTLPRESLRVIIPSHTLSLHFYTGYCSVASIHILLCDVHGGEIEVFELNV